ncbi:PAS domain S-box protein [Algoriphagus halophytocola]|uniref:histidine kinase n=1 Tax=Algoriphagus halophytocola TaxID=2991499 RepID=A0ABY6ME65_9BACT|nr:MULTISPECIES: PAS domain S-box protein [unclassified Algoriphagus]UZD22065.1 PAS domain S-box protein [Algoriphagus sp. TR-M5]WBL43316.1 PAS domain S-box protein [Algoriphagus sp. TR-M9]
MTEQQSTSTTFPSGGGEMGKLIRNKNWAETSLGHQDTWPQSLRTTLDILLSSKFPKFLWWGPELICFYNDAYRPSLGSEGKHPHILGMNGREAWPEIWDTIGPLIEQVMQSGESVWFEDSLIPIFRNGKIEDVYWTFSYSPAKNDEGIISGVLVTCTETTQKVLLNQKLERKERKLSLIIKQAPAAIATFRGKEFVTEIVNEKALELWGRTEHEVAGRPILEAMPELVNQGFRTLLEDVYLTGNRFSASELPVQIFRDGELDTLYINFSFEALYNADGEIDGIITIGHDVTQQVLSHKEIKASEEKLNLALDASELGTFEFYIEEKKLVASRRLHEIYELPFDEQITHQDFLAAIHPDDLPLRNKAHEIALKTGKLSYRARLIMPDNRIKWKELQGKIFYNDQGIPEKILGTVRDITEEKTNQQKLEASEQKFRLLANTLPQHIWTADSEGKLNYFNQSVYEYTGYSPAELDSKGWLDVVHPDDRAENLEAWIHSVTTGKDFLFEHRFRKHDGSYRWQLSRAIPQHDEDGNIQMWVGSSTDIHDQKKFTDELERLVIERTNELAANVKELAYMNKELQSFAYISSHDLQEPLRKIQAFSSLLVETEYENLSDHGKQLFDRMNNAAKRMKTLIDDLLAYSRSTISERKYEATDLNQLIEEVQSELKEELTQAKAEIISDKLCTLPVIPFQFRQLLQNLFSNSLKFSAEGRPTQIIISSEKKMGDEFNLTRLSPRKQYCHIQIKDNGIGFENEYSERIFELFQRLHGKEKFKGTGIGLAIVKKIVDNHNGYITAKGEPGEGATFDIYLPENK